MRPRWHRPSRQLWLIGITLTGAGLTLQLVDLLSFNKVTGLIALIAYAGGLLITIVSGWTPAILRRRSRPKL